MMRLNYRAACSQYGHIPGIKGKKGMQKVVCDRCNKPLNSQDTVNDLCKPILFYQKIIEKNNLSE